MMFKIKTLAKLIRFLGLVFMGSVIFGCNSSNDDSVVEIPPPTLAERLQTVLDQAVTDGLPGVSLAVRGDGVSFAGVAGVEEIATAVPLTVHHRFYLASVGKTYTAVAMVKLAADGFLNLDDPITTWLPAAITDRIPFSDVVTIRSLLNHTSGIFDYQDDSEEWLFGAFLPDPVRHWSNADVLPYILDKPSHFEPLTDVSYSDSNYVLAGLIAEAASGLPIQDLIRNYIQAPLGLQDTIHGYEASGLPSFVHGYLELDGELLDVFPWYSHYGVADGGIQSSAADLAEFVRDVLTGDTVVNAAMRTELVAVPNVGNPTSNIGMGFDIGIGPSSDVITYSSRGKDAGSRADFFHYASAEKSVTIVLCASASLGDYDVWYEQFVQAVIEVLNDSDVLPGAQS